MSEETIIVHSQEIISILWWVLTGVSVLFATLLFWSIKQVLNKLSSIDTTLKIETANIGVVIANLRTMIHSLDNRVSTVETKCTIYHGHERRKSVMLEDVKGNG